MKAITAVERVKRELDLDLFNEITSNMGFHTDKLRADAMGMHPSSLSKIRAGEARPGRKFIEGIEAIGIPYKAIFVPRAK